MTALLVIIRDFNVIRVAIDPSETNAPLVVNAYTKLPRSISSEFFESILRWYSQLIKIGRIVDHPELTSGAALYFKRKPKHSYAFPDKFRLQRGK